MYFLLENLALPSSISNIIFVNAQPHLLVRKLGRVKCTGLVDLRFQGVSSPGHQRVGLDMSIRGNNLLKPSGISTFLYSFFIFFFLS